LKQITEIDDPRVVKALAHPIRIHILRVLQDRVASPREIADELDAKLPNVSYHMRTLERLGFVQLVSTTPRRGAIEHHYRAVARLRITGKAWAQVPAIVKDAMVAATLDQIVSFVGASARIGGFDRKDAHASRQPMVVDAQGFRELSDALDELLLRANEIEAASAKRLAAGDHKDEQSAGLVLMLFEAPPAQTGLPQGQPGNSAHRQGGRAPKSGKLGRNAG
jgi:DNA-binding transcriptional ArsR family regulator